MEKTAKANVEIVKMNEKRRSIETEINRLNIERNAMAYNPITHRAYQNEVNKECNRLFVVEERIAKIERSGISSVEERAIVSAATGYDSKWVTIRTDRSLGCSGATKVGYFPAIGFVEVSYTKYNSFMRNVKGCSSLADKTTVNGIERITEAQARERIAFNRHFGFSSDGNRETARDEATVEKLMAKMVA